IAISPPSASISRTIWPFAWPPIAGLQLICAIVSILPVRSRVEAPVRDAASAASTPAWPAPQTITSNCILLVYKAYWNSVVHEIQRDQAPCRPTPSLPDAEGREQLIEHALVVHLAGDLPQGGQ